MNEPGDTLPDPNFIILNGIDPSGEYLSEPLLPEHISNLALAELDQVTQEQQEAIENVSAAKEAHLGFDAPLDDPADAGWGVIYHKNVSDAFRNCVEKLVTHRADRHDITPKIFEIDSQTGYLDFLNDHGVAPGVGEVGKVPYYLLIVGSPDLISYRFQYELASEYAVGRIEESPAFEAYISQLIEYESAPAVPTARQAVFWAPNNLNDDATQLSARHLALPLYESVALKAGFSKQLYSGSPGSQEASKANLVKILSQPQAPALLFTASHGLGYKKLDPDNQPLMQGALITQEWVKGTPITIGSAYSGNDVKKNASVRGMMHFAFACYSAGTPSQTDYSYGSYATANPVIAPFPFIANLARQELALGALGFIGHIDRAWGYSFIGPKNRVQIMAYKRALEYLMVRGWPAGHCLRDLYDRGLHLSKSLLEDLHMVNGGKKIQPWIIAEKWLERNDARAYALVGDPAARLRINEM